MPIEFSCRVCDKMLRVADASVGKNCECPACKSICTVPMPGAEIEMITAELVEAFDLDGETDVEELRSVLIPCPKCRHDSMCDEALFDTKGLCKNCGHIFLITDDAVKRVLADKTAPTRFVFKCPTCSQLFEGQKSMHGASGKCTRCNGVFEIRLKKAKKSKPKLPPRKKKKRKLPPLQPREHNSPNPHRVVGASHSESQELQLAEDDEPVTVVEELAVAPSQSSASVVQPSPYSQIACGSCNNVMSVENTTPIGTAVACPHCQSQVGVPDLGNGLQQQAVTTGAAAMSTGTELWNDLQSADSTPAFGATHPYANARSGSHRKNRRRGLSFSNAWNLLSSKLFPDTLIATAVVLLAVVVFGGYAFFVFTGAKQIAETLPKDKTTFTMFNFGVAFVLMVGYMIIGAAVSSCISNGVLATMRGEPDAKSSFFELGDGFAGMLGYLALQYLVAFVSGYLFRTSIENGLLDGATGKFLIASVPFVGALLMLTQVYVPIAIADGYGVFDAIAFSIQFSFTRPIAFVFIVVITILVLLVCILTGGLLLPVFGAVPVFAIGTVYHLGTMR